MDWVCGSLFQLFLVLNHLILFIFSFSILVHSSVILLFLQYIFGAWTLPAEHWPLLIDRVHAFPEWTNQCKLSMLFLPRILAFYLGFLIEIPTRGVRSLSGWVIKFKCMASFLPRSSRPCPPGTALVREVVVILLWTSQSEDGIWHGQKYRGFLK